MTTTIDRYPTISEILRGDRHRRPAIDRSIAAGLRAELEDHLFHLAGRYDRREPLTIRAADLREQGRTFDVAGAPSALLRGALVSQLLRLIVVDGPVSDPFDDALDAWRTTTRDPTALALIDQLSGDDRARLATDVTAHAVTLRDHFGSLPASWRPRTSVSAMQRLGGGRVVLRDVIDLVVGSVSTPTSSVVLFDLTTSPLGPGHERTMRYHALVETLRSGVVPLRVVTFSSATGDRWSVDIERTILRRALEELTASITRRWSES